MKSSKERKLNIWNNNRMSSRFLMMMKNHKTEHRKMKMEDEYDRGMMKIIISKKNNNIINRLKTSFSSSSPISDLPEEVLIQVLVRVSVKDILGGCVCVQKSWLSLIKTDMFINYHHKFSNPNKYLLLWNIFDRVYEIRVDDIQCEKYLTLKYPPDEEFDKTEIIVAANGLICGYDVDDNNIYLWNPFFKRYKTLPKLPHHDGISENSGLKCIAFGFVPEINDYLVIYLAKFGFQIKHHTNYMVTCVYSLNTNSWRKITTHHNVPDVWCLDNYNSVVVNGVAAWAAYNSQGKRIVVCFDTKTDVLREILLPECAQTERYGPFIHPFGFHFPAEVIGDHKVGMWVLRGDMMNEYLWEEKVTFQFPNNVPDAVHVLGLRNNGDPILCNMHDMISYNLDSYKAYDFGLSWDWWTPYLNKDHLMPTPFLLTPFAETLLLLNI